MIEGEMPMFVWFALRFTSSQSIGAAFVAASLE